VAAIEASGYRTQGWVEGDLGHGRAYRFEDPFGHVFELYWDAHWYEAEGADRPALKNTASAFSGPRPAGSTTSTSWARM
jgi:catechol 2,3-dioxygenase